MLDELISSQEDSHVNPTAWQESERERRTNATYGQRCCALFENAPRATSWAKTFAALLVGMGGWSSRRCALTWKLVGTPYNRSYFQLAVSVHPTEEIASGLLPTITTETGRKSDFKQGGKSMFTALNETGMLPTPNAFDYNTPRSQGAWDKAKEKHGDALQNPLKQMAAFGMLPTPTAQEGDKITGKENQNSLTKMARCQTGKTSQLSPLFVEEMMGFPRNWTASPFQGGDANPSKPTATPSSRR
jgi:hypothetical protein